MKTLLGILIIPFLFGASCRPYDGPEPSTGEYFSAKVNGKSWSPHSNDFKIHPISCEISSSFDQMSIRARNSPQSIFIIVSTPGSKLKPGKYPLNSDRALVAYFSKNSSTDFQTGNGYGGEIDIKSIDTLKSKISGTFYYTCFNSVLNESVTVSDGRFNMFYY